MYIPKTKVTIEKINLLDFLDEIQSNDVKFYQKIVAVFNTINENCRYAYLIDFPYGYPIIEFGKMRLLEKDKSQNHLHKDKVVFIDKFSSLDSHETLWTKFVKDCERNSDHPLSMVLSNSVEVYTQQRSGVVTKASNQPAYKFPLNQVKVGNLFGVWGTTDMVVFGETNQKRLEWHASAGKSCFQFLFPAPETGKSHEIYRRFFGEIFGLKTTNLTDAIHCLINNKISNKNVKTKILIFPEHYFIVDDALDSPACKTCKLALQHYLFGYGWGQFKRHRDLLWESKELMQKLGFEHNDFKFQLANHLLDVLNCKDYVLKLIDENEIILYEAFTYLCKEFKKKTFKEKRKLDDSQASTTNLLFYHTPFFFYYKTLDESCDQWVLIPSHAPALNTYIPRQSGKFSFDKVEDVLTNHELLTKLTSMRDKQTGKIIDVTGYPTKKAFEENFAPKFLKINTPISSLYKIKIENEIANSEDGEAEPISESDYINEIISLSSNKDFALFNSFFLITVN